MSSRVKLSSEIGVAFAGSGEAGLTTDAWGVAAARSGGTICRSVLERRTIVGASDSDFGDGDGDGDGEAAVSGVKGEGRLVSMVCECYKQAGCLTTSVVASMRNRKTNG